ncbi:A-kinase anchor protein 1, mitochondrial isoform X2 [Pleurodeles waltl]
MALQFRGIFPYTLSGVLAIIGWWWFFSRKKNRITNQPGCPVATGRDQHAEDIQKECISPEEVISSTAPLLQWDREEIPQKCLSHARSSQFGTLSESSIFENVEKTSVSEMGDESSLTEQSLGNNLSSSIADDLEEKPLFQATLLSSALEFSSLRSTQELDGSSETRPKEEMVICKDMEDACVFKYPDTCSLNTEDYEIVGNISQMAFFETMPVLAAEHKELLSTERSDMAITLEGAEDLQALRHEAAVQSSACTEILPLEQDVQKPAVGNMMAYQTQCSSNVLVESIIEENVKCLDLKTCASTHTVNEQVMHKIKHSDLSKVIKVDNDANIIHRGEESVQSIHYGEIASNNNAGHLVTLETSLLQETECILNPSLDEFEHIVLFQENAGQPPGATDTAYNNCIVQPVVHEEEVCTTEGGLTDKDALILFQEKALQSTKAIEISSVNEEHNPDFEEETVEAAQKNEITHEHHPNFEEKTVQAAQMNEITPPSKVGHSIIEANTALSDGFVELNTVIEAGHTETEKAVKSTESFEISTMERVTQPCVLVEKETIKLTGNAEITSMDIQNNLVVEGDVQPTKFTTPVTAERCLQMLISEENIHPSELTKNKLTTDAAYNVIFEKNVNLHAPLPVMSHQDPLISLVEKGSFQTVECNTISLADQIPMSEFCKNHSSGRDSNIAAIDVGLNINTQSSADNAEESIVVGMLMNVDSSPLVTEEDVCQITAFSRSLGKTQLLAGTDTDADFQNETDHTKLAAGPIEQLAMRIVSQVILAATREILSGTVGNMSGISCHILENQVDGSIGLDTGVALPPPISGIVKVLESNRQNTIANCKTTVEFPLQSDNSLRDDTSQLNGSTDLPSSSSDKTTEKENKLKSSVHSDCHETNVNVVSNFGVSFEDASITAEDSGCSACTSEDGLITEEPLQSTALSSIVSTAPLFDSSEIGDTTTDLNVVPDEIAVPSKLQDTNVTQNNGGLSNSGVKHDGHWSTEADHSGGSDVNSMDSVDSGCPLGKMTESHQEPKPGLESKKSDLTVWEIEVPKHLVGRLIGKQGRYVSFLKQTSGAKIYISTLPYTQEFQICHIEGSQPQVDKALNQIGKKFKELNLTNIYAPPPLALPSLPMTSWLMLPDGVTVEVLVVNVVNAGHMFVQQHTHPTFHALRSLDQQMFLCYSQRGIPVLPTPVEVGVICAAPGNDTAWWRAQVVSFYKDSNEVEIRYVDYGGYERVKVDILRQIRSDFVTLPFQGSEVLLDNVIPLPDEDHFSSEADVTVNEMTRGTALLAQVTNYDGATGLPLIQLWSMLGEEVVSINRALVERGFAQWIDGY